MYENYGQVLIAKMSEKALYSEQAPILGCTPNEIESVKALQQVSFIPEVYRQFLSVCGHKAGFLFTGEDYSYSWLSLLKNQARSLAVEAFSAHLVPDDALVILGHQGYVFCFVETKDRIDNPTVYVLEERSDGLAVRILFDSLIDLYENEINTLIKLREKNN
jgi:hypothetical protein